MSETPEIVEEKPPYNANLSRDGLRAGRAFTVVAYSDVEAAAKLQSARGVRYGAVYRDRRNQIPDPFCVLQDMSIEGRPHAIGEAQGIYRIVADYARSNNGAGSREPSKGGPPVYVVRTSLESRPVDHDINGRPIENVVEEPVDPPVTALRPNETLVKKWWFEGTDNVARSAQFRPYNSRLNDKTFLGAPKGCILAHPVRVEPAEPDGWMYHEAAFEYRPPVTLAGVTAYYTKATTATGWIQVQPPIEGWAEIRINKGRRKRIGSANDPPDLKYKRLTTQEGTPITDAVVIDANGAEVTDGKIYALIFYKYGYAALEDIQ